jgi:hypothetical protein
VVIKNCQHGTAAASHEMLATLNLNQALVDPG